MRRTVTILGSGGFRAGKLQGTGIYDEDLVNDYSTNMIRHHNRMRAWYGKHEFTAGMRVINSRELLDSKLQHEGKNPVNGHSAFERELERKGIPIEKYPLPNTVQATRVREMTLLRRLKLEEQAKELMAQQSAAQRRDVPSAWYDETKGPLNPHFLSFVKKNYSGMDVTALQNDPIKYKKVVKARLASE